MTTHDIQQHLWQAYKAYAFTTSELALLAFLIQEVGKYDSKITLLWIPDEQLCNELDVTRRKLRAARRQLVRCRLLKVQTERGNRNGVSSKFCVTGILHAYKNGIILWLNSRIK